MRGTLLVYMSILCRPFGEVLQKMLENRFKINGQHIVVVVVIVSVWYILFRSTTNQVTNITTEQESAKKQIRTDILQTGKKIFLIPDDKTLKGMTEDELYYIFWRYTNTFQVLCRNTMRFGPINDFGKDVCIDEKYVPNTPCLVYSIGSRLQFQFEEAILATYGCEIHTFDPSIKITYWNRHKIPKGVIYHELGIAGRDFVNEQGWTMRTLPTMIKDLHHENRVIDILKMDAEGAEWSGFQNNSDFKALENTKQLLVECHFGRKGNSLWGGVSIVNQLKVLRTLYEKGFRICMRVQTSWLARKIKSSYGPEVGTLTELSLINLRWK